MPAYLDRITIEPDKRSGQPCIRGYRLTVWDVLGMRGAGMSEDEVQQDYPYLTKEDFEAVYAYASEMGRKAHHR